MGGVARLERERLAKFSRFWDAPYQVVPQARADAVAAKEEEIKRDLDVQIYTSELGETARGSVVSWQTIRLGSGGGWAAVKPVSQPKQPRTGKPHTWKGKEISTRQVTKWLERGHGVRKPEAESGRQWARAGKRRVYLPPLQSYVKVRQFYSFTKIKALDHALAAADKVLSRIADEVDY